MNQYTRTEERLMHSSEQKFQIFSKSMKSLHQQDQLTFFTDSKMETKIMTRDIQAAKYKGVAKKIRPVNQPMPQDINPPLERPQLSRDPYSSPLTPFPPDFEETRRITAKRLESVNFGPPGWLTDEELKLLKHVIVLRERAIAFSEEERGILKHEYGQPYKIPVIDHEPWQQRPIPNLIQSEEILLS